MKPRQYKQDNKGAITYVELRVGEMVPSIEDPKLNKWFEGNKKLPVESVHCEPEEMCIVFSDEEGREKGRFGWPLSELERRETREEVKVYRAVARISGEHHIIP